MIWGFWFIGARLAHAIGVAHVGFLDIHVITLVDDVVEEYFC